MGTIIAYVIAFFSFIAFLALWFRIVYMELRAKKDTVKSACNQLDTCRKKHFQATGSSDEQAAKFILSRSLDIYRQSLLLYNRTLKKPQNCIPGYLMGFHLMKEEDHL